MKPAASPNDVCVNPGCGHKRWQHKQRADSMGPCRRCFCVQFRRELATDQRFGSRRQRNEAGRA